MNRNYELRDKIIFGKYDPESYFGGCRHFSCDYATIKELVDQNFIELDECQNCSPNTKDFMEILADVDDVSFTAYAISPDRDDYRVTIEGAEITIPDTDFDMIAFLVMSLRYADTFNFYHEGSKYYLRVWWD